MSSDDSKCSCSEGCKPENSIRRRSFLKLAALTGGLTVSGWSKSLSAEELIEDLYAKYIPRDKNLDPAWVKSLYQREKTFPVYTKASRELDFIGMPVGGLFCGTVYLGGDGRLWIWDIFGHVKHEGVVKQAAVYRGHNLRERDGSNYVNPPTPDRFQPPFAQGIALVEGAAGEGRVFTLTSTGFDNVECRLKYPIGNISYSDKDCPVSVSMDAYSPFIPLDVENSSIPVVVREVTVKNNGGKEWSGQLQTWLENPVLGKAKEDGFKRKNTVLTGKGYNGLLCSAEIAETKGELKQSEDYGSMALAAIGGSAAVTADDGKALDGYQTSNTTGSLTVPVTLKAGEEKKVVLVIAWHFPGLVFKKELGRKQRHYSVKFKDAAEVTSYVAANYPRLSADTRLWADTWSDSTMPQWLLDRAMWTIDTLATQNCYKFDDGRYYFYEGVGCCDGTCTHVWHYAQGIGRVFPEVERSLREKTDFGPGFDKATGGVGMRAEFSKVVPTDGQAGIILRSYREHLMSPDSGFLKRNYPFIKQALQHLIDRDPGKDGLITGSQHNTLDADWVGKVPWLISMYLAALRAGQVMAEESGDPESAKVCSAILEKGSRNLEKLYNGEYFIHEIDKGHENTIAQGTGCEIDQLLGQYWLHQLGLGYMTNKDMAKSAMSSLYKYNFVPDVGPFREAFKEGRRYAVAGDGGLLMCTWPKPGFNPEWRKSWQFKYFNECMSGFEHQAAAHMIHEGLVTEGLAVMRAIHDRHHPSKRNPFNEIECSDHYGRANASYASFIAVTGFYYHGPKGIIGFAPKMQKEDIRAPFITAEGWGTFEQKASNKKISAELAVKWGSLKLGYVRLDLPSAGKVKAQLDGKSIDAAVSVADGQAVVSLGSLVLKAGQKLEISLS